MDPQNGNEMFENETMDSNATISPRKRQSGDKSDFSGTSQKSAKGTTHTSPRSNTNTGEDEKDTFEDKKAKEKQKEEKVSNEGWIRKGEVKKRTGTVLDYFSPM